MIELISGPWPWYVSGFMISVVMFLLIYWGKSFGVSSNLRTICSISGGGKVTDFFKFDWKEQQWNLLFICSAIIGGYIAVTFLDGNTIQLSRDTTIALEELGVPFNNTLMPDLFSLNKLNLKSLMILSVGGLLIGFGARYAGGCTSGHAISGLSNLQLPSLIAVIGFFVGGLIMNHFILPLIF